MTEEEGHHITVMCTECGTIIELHDVKAFLLAQHLMTACPATAPFLVAP